MAAEPQGNERVRTAELIAALCLATDLGMAFPFEHGLHTTLIAMRLAGKLGIDRPSACRRTYYACQLAHAGCTTEAHAAAEIFGGSMTSNLNPVMYGTGLDPLKGLLRALPDPESPPLTRWAQTARRLPSIARAQRPALAAACEVAGMLADRAGAPRSVPGLLAYLMERWDGMGPPQVRVDVREVAFDGAQETASPRSARCWIPRPRGRALHAPRSLRSDRSPAMIGARSSSPKNARSSATNACQAGLCC